MTKNSNRVDNLEDRAEIPPLWVHMYPGQTQAEAFAEHVLRYGPIPADAKVEIIVHTFRSPGLEEFDL